MGVKNMPPDIYSIKKIIIIRNLLLHIYLRLIYISNMLLGIENTIKITYHVHVHKVAISFMLKRLL